MTTHLSLHSTFCPFFRRIISLSLCSSAPSAFSGCTIPLPMPMPAENADSPLAYSGFDTTGTASGRQTTLRQRTQPSQYGCTYALTSCRANDVSVTDIGVIDALADSELVGAGTGGAV